ncbi:hypothetical protein GXW83_25660 [Streptacidiphilus sp. PB12-B1b]|uniref:hypothetical protein n=1 Tax=Streptacidiphilus sp. PB12-B1b TaxID=2705012 RepID=UPI0015FAE02D|nr:hypothetical protein [Streptacidiphilus sp. PB12-B1b]QMU78589.1 hypothetical protein GXW83_25660 [Streptacidiphilus sp. PB12-B1b]
MAGSSRKKNDSSAGSLPADVDLETLYGAVARGEDPVDDEDAELIVVPPVRLLPREELAAAALRVPLLSDAIRLARWVAPFRPVDQWGELGAELETQAALALDLVPDDGDADVALGRIAAAWSLAVDLELIEVGDAVEGESIDGEAVQGEVARPGTGLEALGSPEGADPDTVLEAWETAASIVAGTAVEAEIDLGVPDDPEKVSEDESEAEYAQLEEDREETQGLLDDALQVLYEARAFAATEAEQTVSLGVLAALLVTPDGQEPDEEMLGDITAVMVTLDPMLQDLAGIGMVDYSPIDPTLFEEAEGGEGAEEAGAPGGPDATPEADAAQAARFGMARLTPLGVHGVRQWLLEDGYDAPLVGEHARGDAVELLTGICGSANVLPEEEIGEWLAGREPQAAAAELLAASRGNDVVAPVRRMFCLVALDRLGEPAEPSVRAVLDDPELAGMATGWLLGRGAQGLPELSRSVLLWSQIDSLAAQLIDSSAQDDLFRELIQHLTEGQQIDLLFADLWRVDHPYTTAVLEAVGELHPDRPTAKEARKAAYKARSRAGSQDN